MADNEDRRPCSFRQCHGEMMLKKHQPGGAPPARRPDAKKTREPQWLRAWECTSERGLQDRVSVGLRLHRGRRTLRSGSQKPERRLIGSARAPRDTPG